MIVYLVVCLVVLLLWWIGGSTREKFDDPFKEIEREASHRHKTAQLFDDITFRDVRFYDNQPDGRMGLDRCLDNNTGYCVEYGQTGTAYYYPPMSTNMYYGELINTLPTQRDVDGKRTDDILVAPALR